MNRFDELHEEAMSLAERGDEARRTQDEGAARTLFWKAFEKERDALRALGQNSEPSRSVLLRSVASLAVDAGALDEAEAVIAEGLAGTPPRAIRLELESLRADVAVQKALARAPEDEPPRADLHPNMSTGNTKAAGAAPPVRPWYPLTVAVALALEDLLPVDSPGPMVLSPRGLAEIRPFLPRRVVWLLQAQMGVFRREVERPVVRASTLEEALGRFDARMDVVGAVRVSLHRALADSRTHSAALREALGNSSRHLSERLKSPVFRLLGRPQGWMLLTALQRASETARSWFDLIDAYSDLGAASSLMQALLRPEYAALASSARSLDGLLLVLAMAFENDPKLESHPGSRTVLQGLVAHAWESGLNHRGRTLQWLLGILHADAALRERASALHDRLHAELSAPRYWAGLATEWKRATGHLSNPAHILRYPAYRYILHMGWDAVPMMLGELAEDLKKGESPWFWGPALLHITGEEPRYEEGEVETPEGVGKAWLRLAEERGWQIGASASAGEPHGE